LATHAVARARLVCPLRFTRGDDACRRQRRERKTDDASALCAQRRTRDDSDADEREGIDESRV
jgi:hypothetical protein